ncbi:MAG: hydroxyethylthiazole kinase [Candidatus Micrarchaeia archaeon]
MQSPFDTLEKVRKQKPLVHHITNWVTIYDSANVVRAFGALPVMAHATEEAADMAGISSALVLNIGTLTRDVIDSMLLAGEKANEKGIPIVLDAVGAGATKFRNEQVSRLIGGLEISVIKGNAGELASIAGIKSEVRGVESISAGAPPEKICSKIAGELGCTAVITGKTDVSASKKGVYFIDNGHQMMGAVVGTGCMAASAIGAFCAVEKDCALASAHALSCFGIAGELAAKESKGPGTFKANFYDEIYNLDRAKVEKYAKVRFDAAKESR